MENFIRKILAQLSTAEKIRLAYGRKSLSIGKLEKHGIREAPEIDFSVFCVTFSTSLFPYVVDCMCGNNNQSLKQVFFKPCFSKCAQFTGRYQMLSITTSSMYPLDPMFPERTE